MARSGAIMTTMVLALAVSGGLAACATGGRTGPEEPAPADGPRRTRTVTVRDPELEREATRLRLLLLEREALVKDLQRQVDEARTEVVHAMARLRSLATRAEAASAVAEAEVANQQLEEQAGRTRPPELAQAASLLSQASTEFDNGNYGGAVYLATQAKRAATAGRGRLAEAERGPARPGETPFAVPVPLEVTTRSNVRAGPGTNFDVAFMVEAGARLTGYAYVEDWVRVATSDGRSGWVYAALVRGSN